MLPASSCVADAYLAWQARAQLQAQQAQAEAHNTMAQVLSGSGLSGALPSEHCRSRAPPAFGAMPTRIHTPRRRTAQVHALTTHAPGPFSMHPGMVGAHGG